MLAVAVGAGAVKIWVLGPLVVSSDDHLIAIGGRRQRSVLTGLVVAAGETISTERLMAIVWGADPPPTARKSLQTYVSRLRRLLGDDVISTTSSGYRLRMDMVDIDADRFDALVEQGRDRLETDPDATWALVGDALDLWRGVPLSDVEANDEVDVYVQRLGEARLRAIELRMSAGLALGRHAELVAELQGLVDAHPMRERLWEQLILALYGAGRQAEALAAYQRCAQQLAAELGIDPSPPLRRLHARVLVQDAGLDAPGGPPPAPEPVVRNPYKGLRAFGEADADDFFGREALVEDLVSRIEHGARFLALVGPSGSGKSSVALAGLVPALRRAEDGPVRLVARMTPGTHPFAQLEAALRRASPDRGVRVTVPADDDLGLLRAVLALLPGERAEVLLVVDQFEELLTGTVAQQTVQGLLRNLAEALEDPHGQLTVVVTLRADFLDAALRHPELAELLGAGLVQVPPLTSAELQAAIVRPARAVGLQIEPELVAELVHETAQHPGSLPLLQFVLTQLTDDRTGVTLTLAGLREAGGIHGTLARRAEALYAGLSEEGQQAARSLLLHLVALNEVGEATRRVVALDDLRLPGIDPDVAHAVQEQLVRGRLLAHDRESPSGRPTVEVAHEAVLRAWPRCAAWIQQARGDIRMALELDRAAADWEASGRSVDYLLTGSRLRLFDDWAPRSPMGIPDTATALLEASIAHRRQEERLRASQEAHEAALERRAVTRLRVAVGVLVLLAVVTTGLSLVAAARSSEADRQRQAAVSAADERLMRQLTFAAVAEAASDPELALLLGLHAVQAAATRGQPVPRETIEALHWGLQALRVTYPVADGQTFRLTGVDGTRGAYELPLDQLAGLARAQVDRDLTESECRTYLSLEDCPSLDVLDDLPVAAEPAAPVATVHGPELAGTRVTIRGLRSPTDEGLLVELATLSQATGIDIDYVGDASRPFPWEGLPNLANRFRIGWAQAGDTDIVITSQVARVGSEARAGRLADVGRYLPREQVVADYGPSLAALSTVGPDGTWPSNTGTLHAVPLTLAVTSQVWFVPDRFAAAGYSVPTAWDQLVELSDQIVADGGTPWCFAEGAVGPGAGWPATNWVTDLLLHEFGPLVYDDWVAGEIPFSDPRVRTAFARLGDLFFTDGYVHRGREGALVTPWHLGYRPLLDDPPGCWMYYQGSFVADIARDLDDLELGTDISAFPTPAIEPDLHGAMVGEGEFALVYRDRPEVRAVVNHLASPNFGRHLVAEDAGGFAANRRFPRGAYPDPWRREMAVALSDAQAADLFRFDGWVLMPPWLGTEVFDDAMIDYLRGGPGALDDVLARLDGLEPPPP
jgi:DNA-binding SARP family transcriptional activator/ABC-type glycerol-3-phosphate transport system substrate-binding protein